MGSTTWWRRAARVACVGAIGALGVLGSGCSSDPPAAQPPDSSRGTALAGDAPREGTIVVSGGTSTVVEPPVTFAAADPSATQVFEGLSTRLPMTDDERACAADRLSGDRELLDRVKGGVTANTPDFDALMDLMTTCRQVTTFSDAFVAGFGPGVSDEQKRCLHDAFGRLSKEDLDAVYGAALQASGSLVGKGPEVAERVLGGCGVKR